ncbi:DUF397 domain-containing protein [Glycomyces dulcitolivorans]|uniref:DUF397 domain-containing protein n=1 Tax=Glycomyces dulcitolivorans TaxID=2200759 RepID=UPI000DD32AB4|nr:DUF397 domain-containing protein [Glycomyces dulcitolivorans]
MTGYGDWRKSTRSNSGDDSSCVEARTQDGAFQVRDSKLGHDSPIFDLSTTDFKALISAAELVRSAARPVNPRFTGRAFLCARDADAGGA